MLQFVKLSAGQVEILGVNTSYLLLIVNFFLAFQTSFKIADIFTYMYMYI